MKIIHQFPSFDPAASDCLNATGTFFSVDSAKDQTKKKSADTETGWSTELLQFTYLLYSYTGSIFLC